MKDTISNRLKKIMKERNLKQVDLLKKSLPYQKELDIKMGKSTLSQYVNGVQTPDQNRIYLLSKVLDVNEPWLMGYDVSKKRVPDEQRIDNKSLLTRINEISSELVETRQERVLAFAEQHLTVQEEEKKGDNIIHFNNYSGQELQVNGFLSAGTGETLFDDIAFKMTYKGYIPPHDIALQVNGDSMEPMFENKQIIFVEKTTQIKSGQIGVVIIDGEAYLKKVFINDDNIRLVSLNKKYKDMYFYKDHDVRLVGRVIL
ncbi:S24 family peptidase [Staphylococcus gallinarum]|uniref:S24 family peptidase n=1 Tax=Staphylococcus gallinarum TaxID=1293 RepID=UPI001E40B830|nr:S24 family peptidase [Staphylococcus gallinarum]MCD8825391.1 helix-turn-helix domain-containing protein [Staphylococcus gallinarum]